ncbi:ABC-F family ATP-binding cassette domain-containing protein [Paucilactobacillus suebicus]|uniref:ABC transporter-like protein n=1 Tax=Paucilactobacillus suebicus DSM 5007 = KCTC 3549 TaxID=1423807 RepID=A0A0R1W1U0_9LACO|nr:ABC-F family ATP-binding cassette domain-containing protein [Paucilactobacillus suebicus]KRM11541.1 ABC transporter-like protein [Paucilactobacillus suebicus DSM 5007 = KCTC 3549]
MQTLRADNLTSTYGEKTLFKDASFLINENDRIGLIGTNGSGKTSLLNVISGLTNPESGNIEMPKDYTIGYLKQQPELDDSLTIIDAIFAGSQHVFDLIRRYELAVEQFGKHPEDTVAMDRYTKLQVEMDQQDAWAAESRIKTILTQLKINDMSQIVGNLSGGQKKRIGLAQVLIQEPDLLLLDEPTNHLDLDSVVWLQDYLNSYKGAVLVVTHDRYFLDQVTNFIWELSFGTLYYYTGNYQDYVAQKAERVQREADSEHKQQQLYQKELAWMRTGAKARSTKQKGRINHFNELKESVGKLNVEQNIDIELGQQRLGKDVIQLENANLSLGGHQLLQDFNMLIQAGQRIGISGENGAGKSSLLNVMAGKLPLDSGTVKIGETVKIGYYTQQTEPIDEDKRMISYLSEVAQSVTDKNGVKINVTQLLERFLFPRFMHGTLIRKLSGGEKRRLYLLKILMMQPNVLFLDEPTNDLDIGTLTVLEDYLDSFNGTVITVSHDRYFLDKVADRLLIFDGESKIERFDGMYTDYLAQQSIEPSTRDESITKSETESKKLKHLEVDKPHDKTKLTYSEQMEWDHIEDDIDALESEKKDVQAQMQENGDDYDKLAKLQQRLEELDKSIDEKTERWEYLSEYALD